MAEPAFDSNASDITNKSNKPLVSLLLRTKNEEAFIGRTIEALLSQTYKNIELIVVDSGSTDNTLEISRKYPVSIYEIAPEDFTFGYSLNYGFQKAQGKYVACLSAHALPVTDNWLETLVSNFTDNSVASVMSNTVPMPDCNPFDRRGLTKKFSIPKQEIFPRKPYIYSNACSMMRKSVWEKIHFDETLTAAEDYDWIDRAIKKKYRIIYEPLAKVYHSHNETLKQIYTRSYREEYAELILKLKQYSMFSLLVDLLAGTIYDMAYVILKRDNIKWLVFAPFRRVVMNYARFQANRAADKNNH